MLSRNRFLYSPDDGSGSGDGNGGGDGGQGGSQTPPPGQAPNQQSGGTQDVATLQAELKRARDEAASFRVELRDAKAEVEKLQGAQQSKEEQLQSSLDKKNEELTTATQRVRELQVQVLGAKVGIHPTARADAARLLDWDRIKDPDNQDKLEEALRELVKDRPYLLGDTPGGGDGGAGGQRNTGGGDMNDLIRGAAGQRVSTG